MAWWQFWKSSPVKAIRSAPIVGIRAVPSGRVSKDHLSDLIPGLVTIAPPSGFDDAWRTLQVDRKLLEHLSPTRLLEILADLSPEVSRALWDFLRLCNPGWEATAYRIGSEKTQHVQAQAAVQEFLDTLDDHYGSVDVLFGRLFMGGFLRGALFAELVLDKNGRAPVDIATPDPVTVRFRRVNDPVRGPIWQPGQWQNGQFVAFDRPTVRYTPIDPFPGNPYGRPLAAPALFTSLFLLGMLHDIRRVVQQQGYPRLDISLDTDKLATILEQYAGDAEAYQAALQKIVDQVSAAYSQLEPDDTYIHTDVVTVNRPVGAVDSHSLGAIDGLIAALERMATRALKSMPIMMGLSESNTETQANRQYEVYAAGIKSIQHYTETLLERLLTLALEAQGLQARVEFRFAEIRAAEALRDAQTETMQIANATAKYMAGWISQDQASEEITGEPADVPEPRSPFAPAFDLIQDDGDGQEALEQGGDRAAPVDGQRVKIIPDGADEPLTPVPEEVTISDSEVERALETWDDLMDDYAGLLDAEVQNMDGEGEERAVGTRANGSPWVYDRASHRYRNTATGRYIGPRQMVDLRDQFTDALRGRANDLAAQLADGRMTLQQWELAMRQQVKIAHVDQYVLGRGGRNAMTPADWGRVGRELRDQYGHLHRFAQDIAEGKLSAAQISARGRLYFDSATSSYERGRAADYGMPTLPQYPADGNTACRSNCRCSWRIRETDDSWLCTWVIRPGENCQDCLDNAARWNPLALPKAGRSRAQVERELAQMTNGHH